MRIVGMKGKMATAAVMKLALKANSMPNILNSMNVTRPCDIHNK